MKPAFNVGGRSDIYIGPAGELLGGVLPAVSERIVYILQRHFPMSGRKPVFQDCHCNALAEHPVGHVDSLIVGRYYAVSASRADHNHLAVCFFREIKVYPRKVGDVADIAVPVDVLFSGEAVFLAHLEPEGFYNLALYRVRKFCRCFLIKEHCLVWPESGIRLCRYCFHHKSSCSQYTCYLKYPVHNMFNIKNKIQDRYGLPLKDIREGD